MMKKLLLASTSAFVVALATPALAGGSSTTLQQTGNDQHATIDQTYGSNGQVGTAAHPFTQQNGAGAGSNVIVIDQRGSYNSVQGWSAWGAPSYGLGAVAGNSTGYPGQSGTANKAEINQYGERGDVTLSQRGSDNGDNGVNSAGGRVTQGTNSLRDSAFITQNGDNNLFTITQDNTNSAAGTSNPHNNSTNLQQSGTHNDATITQYGTYTPSVNPYGVGLSVTAYQYGGWNHLDSYQSGSQNSLYSRQSWDGLPSAFGQKNIVSNNQSGYSNRASIGLTGPGQSGHDLTIITTQSGTGQTLNVVEQLGNNNQITNTQSNNGNTATVLTQNGTGLVIYNNQTGSGGSAQYSQTGTSNTIRLINQTGLSNSVEVHQAGSNSVANMLQIGAGTGANSITVNQTYGNHNLAFLVQGGTFSGTGDTTGLYTGAGAYGNTINVTQDQLGALSGNNYVAVQQQSNSNTSTTTQSGSNNTATIKQ
jgi:hypothetical protein